MSWWLGRVSRLSSTAACNPNNIDGSIVPWTLSTIFTTLGNSCLINSSTWAFVSSFTKSVLLKTTKSAQASWSAKSSCKGVSCSRLSSACRCAATASGSLANVPFATAAQSTIVITASTVAPDRISCQRKAFTSGFGNAKPEVSIKMQSILSRRLSNCCIVGKNSSCTVQHKQPLVNSKILVTDVVADVADSLSVSPTDNSSVTSATASVAQTWQDFNKSPSIPSSPNSLTTTAIRRPWLFCSRWRMRLVLPLPKKPVITVTGILAAIVNCSFF